jgi:TfoX/Sxy family transcriptional regulator of competence genes
MTYDEQLADRLREILTGEPGLSERKMFGGLAFLVHGHLAVAASREGGLLLRADPDRTEELLGEPHTSPFVMRNREMRGWLRVESAGVTDDAALERWAEIGAGYARTLPPK